MQRYVAASAFFIALTLPTVSFAAGPSKVDPSVLTALKTIEKDASDIAAGRFRGKALQAPAREIALAWSQAEPALARNGNALVETKMANTSISAFERDWQKVKDVRGEAKDVRSNVADLVDAVSSGG